MKQNINLYIAAALMLTLGGCNKGLGPEDAGSITIEATVGDMTKVSYDGNKTRFTEGDQITVYGWLGSTAEVPSTRVVNGVKCTLGTDGTWTPESPMYWAPGGEAHYFLAVYPARKIRRFTDEEFILDPADYRASDLLIATNLDGVKASDGPVALSFDHAMAKLVVNLKFRSEFGGAPSVGSVTVTARKTATVNYLTKAVTASGSVQRVSLPDAAAAPEGYSLSFSGLLIPQEGVRKVTVSIGLNEYVYESATDIPLKSGQYTTLGFIVGKEKIELASVSVSDWETAEDLPGGEALQEVL